MGLFCNHDWAPKTGMDSGSYCTQCGKSSEKEIDISKSGGLNNGILQDKISSIREKSQESNPGFFSNLFKR